jgi:hypothetical protein
MYRRATGHSDDTKSALELGKFPDAKPALRAALSCNVDPNKLLEYIAVHEDWYLVYADLNPEHGMVAQTGKDPSHHSLWLTRAALAAYHTLFRRLP